MAVVREHFRLLDGLRGVAAIAVVAYHFGGRADMPYLLPRGYLAVDFFFVLSGFVIAYAYGERLRTTLTARHFALQRLIRLLPMLIPGTLFGALIEVWRPGVADVADHLREVVLMAVLGCMALPWPFPTSMEQTIFPINGPVWSLFFELVANFVFIAVARAAFPRARAMTLMSLGALGVIVYSLVAGTVDIGPLLIDWPGGFPRVCFSFFAGVLVFAHRHRFPALPAWIFPCVLLVAFAIPVTRGGGAMLDLAIIVVLFPFMIGMASNCAPTGSASRVCALAGDISYPLYAIHYPIVRAICFVINKTSATTPVRIALAGATIAGVVGLSWLLFRFYDRPLRDYLTRRLRARGDRSPGGSGGATPGKLAAI